MTHITEAESALLDVLWREGPLPPQRFFAEVSNRRPWARATVKTLLARLMHKSAIRSERAADGVRYHAILEREQYVAAEVRGLAERLFDGDLALLAAYAERLRTAQAGTTAGWS